MRHVWWLVFIVSSLGAMEERPRSISISSPEDNELAQLALLIHGESLKNGVGAYVQQQVRRNIHMLRESSDDVNKGELENLVTLNNNLKEKTISELKAKKQLISDDKLSSYINNLVGGALETYAYEKRQQIQQLEEEAKTKEFQKRVAIITGSITTILGAITALIIGMNKL